MINLESLSKTFPDGDLFTNVNLTIKHGMRAGLVGPNGSGKTTLLRIMLKQESHDSGNVQVEKSITIGYLAQDIVVGSNHSILEEVLAAYPEVQALEKQLMVLSHKITVNPENETLVNQLGTIQHRFEALGGWTLDEKAKKAELNIKSINQYKNLLISKLI